jgi:hypothetical protein
MGWFFLSDLGMLCKECKLLWFDFLKKKQKEAIKEFLKE